MKRVFYFVATNLAILLLLGVVLSIFGLDGRSTGGALVIAAIFGMGGSFISVAMSIFIAELGFAGQPESLLMAKTGVLFASVLAGVGCYLWLRLAAGRN